MREESILTALSLLKARRNRAKGDTSLDEYFRALIEAAIGTLTKNGIALTDEIDDIMLVVDVANYNYANRDKNEGVPEWLRLKRRERWLNNP